MLLTNIPIRATGTWMNVDGYVIIKNEIHKVILNKRQSYLWNKIDGNKNIGELIEELSESNNVDKELLLNFIANALEIRIIYFYKNEWEVN